MFFQDWWLDAVCGRDRWDVVLATRDRNKSIVGALPYFYQRKYGFLLLRMPYLTPYLGPIYNYPSNLEKQAKKYAFEKKVTQELLAQLPAYSYFNQHCDTRVTNGQPFHWNGFSQLNQYTFQLDLNQEIPIIQKNYESSVRNEIRRAKEKGLTLSVIDDINIFIKINERTFSVQGKALPYSPDMIRNLDGELRDRKLRTIYGAYDSEQNLHAAIYLLQEKGILYTLMIGTDADYRNSGAVQFLVDEIIQLYHADYHTLDFCGSMIENIEKVFRSFGPRQIPYLRIFHKRSTLFQIISSLRGRA